jgi:hypothetical protein
MCIVVKKDGLFARKIGSEDEREICGKLLGATPSSTYLHYCW